MPNAILMLGASMESVSAEEGILATAFRAKEVGLCLFNENEKSLITDRRTLIIFVNPKCLGAYNAMKKSPLIATQYFYPISFDG